LDINEEVSVKNYKYIHFIGIGGISMSGLAEIMLNRGCKVTGSDINETNLTEHLKNLGAVIQKGHDGKIIDNQNLVVFTAAVNSENPEYIRAEKLGIKLLERADFLGELMHDYNSPVAISGTHGKTTTTGFMSSILLKGDSDPTILIGGEYDLIKGNIRIGNDETILTEACEYKRSFVKFNPFYGVVLNIEEDHLDYYKDIDDIKSAFLEFGSKIPDNGYLVYNSDCGNSKHLFDKLSCNLRTFGIKDKANIWADNITYTPYPSFNLHIDDTLISKVSLKVPGEHNLYNALAAVACAHAMDIENSNIIEGIQSFTGTKRRFQYKGILNGASVIDDYAHHPTEIKTTLKTVREMTDKRVLCVFQPHTYTRTFSLLKEFSEAFSDADTVLVVDIYAAREKDLDIVHSKDLVEGINRNNTKAIYCSSFEEAEEYFRTHSSKGDIIMTMGAGNVHLIGENITES
jgi:UDP-N-acetylmuramate--alanine ligase